ncbi:MAG: zinc-binding dehydrogenase [Acidimicrobiia bacterium]
MSDAPTTTRQIQSLVTAEGTVRAQLVDVALPPPGDDEVVVAVEAAPINPSDLGLLFAVADLTTLRAAGTDTHPALEADIPEGLRGAVASRVGQALPVGNEGAGTVVAAGGGPAAQALLGRTVALLGGSMYAGHRVAPVSALLPMPDGTAARDAASCFVNPLTALGMVETMRLDGHSALVHTAAASNLGQMLNRICLADGVELVNIVRRPEQEALLRDQGARYVVDTSADGWQQALVSALVATGATVAFDAIGGGRQAGHILTAMESAINARSGPAAFNRYGSAVHKQVYVYGGLDRGPTEFNCGFGMAWGIGGWLLTNFLNRVGPEVAARLRQRVVDELHTTFASSYTAEVSLAGMLQLDAARQYSRQATGTKYLVLPQA